MERPTADFIRTAVFPQIDWAARGYPAPAGADPDPLQFQLDVAIDYVEWVTGRPQDATMPENLVRTAQLADALRLVQQLTDFSADQLDAIAAADVLQSFSADGYSETYRTGGSSATEQAKGLLVNPWAPLNRLLWMLMTPEKLAYWIAFLQGGGVPQWGVAEIDWSGQNRWGGIAGEPGDGGLAGEDWPGGWSDKPSIYPGR